ncbi:MAG: hypothetical protein QOJ40_2227 [Verrucomicrobiota bacterium]
MSVVVESVQPGPAHVRQWSGVDYFGSFLAALELWKYIKDYIQGKVRSQGLRECTSTETRCVMRHAREDEESSNREWTWTSPTRLR